jgi:hypothetical protein
LWKGEARHGEKGGGGAAVCLGEPWTDRFHCAEERLDGNYQLDWKSPASYAGSCKRLRLDLFEGTAASPVFHTADFHFR